MTDWQIIPELLLDAFDSCTFSLANLLQVMQLADRKGEDLTKLGENFTNILKLSILSKETSTVQITSQILNKYSNLDNNLMKALLKEHDYLRGQKILTSDQLTAQTFDMIKFYALKPEADPLITQNLSALFSGSENDLKAAITLLQSVRK